MTDPTTWPRRTVLAGALLPATVLIPAAARAQPTLPTQLPALSRVRIGDIAVTALSDGYLPIPPDLLPGLGSDVYRQLLDRSGFRGEVYTGGVTAYLIETADRRILIDAGTGPVMGPTLGQFSDNLALTGIGPECIDMVIATHLHPDHIGGLLEAGATPFANAELVLHAADRAFWTDAAAKARFPADVQPFFDLATSVVTTFQDRLHPIDGDTDIAPGLTAVPLPGHTPGHMGVRIESGGETVLMWGDIVHAAPIQMPRPEVAIAFDVDQAAAVATRQALFDSVAADDLLVLGSHLPFPGFGRLERRGDGYAFAPAHWEYA